MTAPVPGDFWSKMRDHARAEVERFSRSGFLRNSGLTGTGNALTASQGASIVQHDVPGNTLFKLDPSGEGLDHPRYDLGAPHPTAYALWPNTTSSTTPVSVAEKIILPHHRRILWNASVTGDTGTQGTCQLYLNGSPLSPLHTSLVGGETDWQDVLTLPDGFYDQLWTAQVMCRVTSGTGSVRAATWALLGIGTT